MYGIDDKSPKRQGVECGRGTRNKKSAGRKGRAIGENEVAGTMAATFSLNKTGKKTVVLGSYGALGITKKGTEHFPRVKDLPCGSSKAGNPVGSVGWAPRKGGWEKEVLGGIPKKRSEGAGRVRKDAPAGASFPKKGRLRTKKKKKTPKKEGEKGKRSGMPTRAQKDLGGEVSGTSILSCSRGKWPKTMRCGEQVSRGLESGGAEKKVNTEPKE